MKNNAPMRNVVSHVDSEPLEEEIAENLEMEDESVEGNVINRTNYFLPKIGKVGPGEGSSL